MTDDELTRIVARACMSSPLEPIGRGNNGGRIWSRGGGSVVVDTFGHEGNAEFLSNAQADVLKLADEIRRLRAAAICGDAQTSWQCCFCLSWANTKEEIEHEEECVMFPPTR